MSRDASGGGRAGGGSSRSPGVRPCVVSSPGPVGGPGVSAGAPLPGSVLRAGGWLRLHAGSGVCVDLRLWVEKATGEVGSRESGDPGKDLRGRWGQRAGCLGGGPAGGLVQVCTSWGVWGAAGAVVDKTVDLARSLTRVLWP